ncbi:MAG: site-specific tyrosine recombinase/integron integrase [Candidatus Hermodarchaeota archaeon]
MDVNEELIKWFIQVQKRKRYSPGTCKQYKYDLLLFLKFLDNKPANEVSKRDIDWFLDHLLTDREYAAASIHRKICSLRSFYKFLQKNKDEIQKDFDIIIKADPTANIESPKVPKSMPKFLKQGEILHFLGSINNIRDRAIVELLYATGMRVSELCNVMIEDINWEDNLIKVQKGKGSKQRYVVFSKRAQVFLKDYIRDERPKIAKKEEQALFVNRFGKRLHPITVQRIVAKYRKNGGFKDNVTPHCLRHTFATHSIQGGMDIRYIQELLGHNSLSTTQIYTHVDTRHLRKVYNQVFSQESEE